MANTTKSHDGAPDQRRTGGDDDRGPRVIVEDLGRRGAGWVVVDGEPVVVIDSSLSELDRRRLLAATVSDFRAWLREGVTDD